MTRGLMAGMTDYSHQSLDDILTDLKSELGHVKETIKELEAHGDVLIKNGYWNKNVPYDFKSIIGYSLKHYKTTVTEITDIIKEVNIEVMPHHVQRLRKIAEVADQINVDIGQVWHRKYDSKDYGEANFMIVEEIYAVTRNAAGNLLDVSNMAGRLNDFIGKTKHMKKNNPWISGSFYLFVAIVIITGLAVMSKTINWAAFPIVVIAGVIIITLIGVFQLKNDDKLKDESFVTLIKETFKRLPLLKNIAQK
jgi:hypothetical protein